MASYLPSSCIALPLVLVEHEYKQGGVVVIGSQLLHLNYNGWFTRSAKLFIAVWCALNVGQPLTQSRLKHVSFSFSFVLSLPKWRSGYPKIFKLVFPTHYVTSMKPRYISSGHGFLPINLRFITLPLVVVEHEYKCRNLNLNPKNLNLTP